ncbi:MAG: 3-dehydroquinate synthase II [Methanomicrobiales archaeon]|nr:3-dehydroquinate synthase II [Methanomicrobiales archaeon]
MKEFWVDIRPWKKALATAAIESGADAVVVEKAGSIRELGRVCTVAPDGDLILGKDVVEVQIADKAGEQAAVEKAKHGLVIVSTTDWTVIPLENLVAQSDHIIALVHTKEEAELALSALEKGVHGILLRTGDPGLVREIAKMLKNMAEQVSLRPFTVIAVRPVGMGDRVCVDTCSILSEGQGLLVGDTSAGFLLIHAETLVNPYVAPRPFRINAGGAHAYLLMPSGKTSYLSELHSGDHVLIVDEKGDGTQAIVGRVKIERRPLIRVEAETERTRVSLILQNAETIRLIRPDGTAVSVVELKEGDQVLGLATESGRHFGMAIHETIIEK